MHRTVEKRWIRKRLKRAASSKSAQPDNRLRAFLVTVLEMMAKAQLERQRLVVEVIDIPGCAALALKLNPGHGPGTYLRVD